MNGQCEWTTVPIAVDPTNPGTVDPTKPTTPSIPAGETPLFTKEFCHPVKVDKATAEGDFAACLPKSATECTGTCVWSNGKALIPDRDFCAPAFMTDDVQTIASCVDSDTDATCVTPCKWRRGKQAPTDIPSADAVNSDVTAADLEGPLFSKRFCHPVSIESWEKNAQACLSFMTAPACPSPICAWTDAKELIPATDFCAPSKMTLDTVNFETCAKLDTEANCVKGCQWYRGTGVKPVDPTRPVT
jgi:hypothetical protein